ncbi:flagellar hook capping FlgD N-terminal domain-containing protein [Clostridium sp. ATCC 25772]|uniref:flagellar hook capping FlgD N-terminal domain-containing protein n=1 Tax=Clostridium sp. ATCC 25772 TaxID=1676991 RepID=UPI0007805D6B|nr:flagellar hook capping FlgD N-terminal domain-containing protein [Clostridium sp. ATCC 25772]
MPNVSLPKTGNSSFQMDQLKKDSKASATASKTERGTNVVKPGEDMNKNMFLQILAAELANQDPTQPQDNTQYVTQMAQFSSLEQMANLNTTMRLSGAQGLVGKFVALNVANTKGEQEVGVVQSVYKNGSNVYITVVTADGEIKSFDYNDVLEVAKIDDPTLDYINFINGANLIGKDIELWDKDVDGKDPEEGNEEGDEEEKPIEKPEKKRPYGTVTEIFRDEEGIKVKVHLKDEDGNLKYDENGKPEIKDYPFDYIMNIKKQQ